MKRDLRNIVLATILLGLALPGMILAQTYDIPTAVIGGGGGTSSGGSYQLSGTAGMPAGGIGASGGSYILDGGFWPTVQALTAPTGLRDTLIVDKAGAHDPANGQYSTLQSVVDSLVSKGVSGPTTVLVKDGTYNWVIINPIPGTSVIDTVVFKAHPDNAEDAIISHSATGSGDNWVIKLDGAKHITIDGFTIKSSPDFNYAIGIALIGDTDNLNIVNNTLSGSSYAGSSSLYAPLIWASNVTADSVRIQDNTFIQGNYGIYFDGTATRGTHNEISGNTFHDQYYRAITMKEQDAPGIGWNRIYGRAAASTAYNGIYVEDCDGDMTIIYNWMHIPNGGTGIYHTNSGADAIDKALIANNAIHMDGGTNKTNVAQGINLRTATYQQVYFNTVHMTTWDDGSAGLYVTSASNNLDVRNNIFSVSGAGLAMYYEGTASVATSDFNLLHTRGNYLANWGSANYRSLADLQAVGSSQDDNSLTVNPWFAGDTLFVPRALQLDNMGTSAILGIVYDDITGYARITTTPDIGAYEFDVTGTPMSGTFTVGNGGTFASITEAMDDLQTLGVSGPTTIEFLPGTYGSVEGIPFGIPPIAGAGASSRVTFLGDTLNPAAVTLQYAATASTDNRVIQIDGGDFITIRGLRLVAQGADYATCIQITGGADKLTIVENALNGLAAAGTYDRRSLIFSDGSIGDNRIFSRNTFEGGTWGIYYNTGLTGRPLATGTEVDGNSFTDQDYRGVYLGDQDAPIVRVNAISTSSDDYNFRGIHLDYCDNDTRIEQNTLTIRMGYGIYQNYSDGTASYPGLVANNLITIGDETTNYARGIYQTNTSYQNVYHNTVHIANTGVSTYRTCYYNTGAVMVGSINVRNNIFSNTGDGYVYYIATISNIGTSNNNSYHYTGTSSFYWSPTTYSTLAEYQGTGQDGASLAGDPLFVDAANGDYRLSDNSPLLGQGVDVGITADIESNTRPFPLGSYPDMGAYENPLDAPDETPPNTPAGLMASSGYGEVTLSWEANSESDLNHYTLYRDTTPFNPAYLAEIPAPGTSYLDTEVNWGTTYYYWLSASDNVGNESGQSAPVNALVETPPFSEAHSLDGFGNSDAAWGDYDNDGDLDILISGSSSTLSDISMVYAYDPTSDAFTPDGGVQLTPIKSTPALKWWDYNGDGNLDILLSGWKPEGAGQVEFSEIYKGETDGTFTPLNAGLADFAQGDIAWGDYDNDGDLDVALSGWSGAAAVAGMYRNDGGTFSADPTATWPALTDGSVDLGDYDNDGDLDVLVTGINGNGEVETALYNNNGGQFGYVNTTMPNLAHGNAAWGDYDSDGDLDILLCGNGGGSNVTMIFSNGGSPDYTYTEIAAGLPGIKNGMAAWGNYDNDGDLDVLVSGVNDETTGANVTQVYQYDSGAFVDVDIIPDALSEGAAAWGDYDNDGDLDILVTGNDEAGTATTKVYRNNSSSPNQPPGTPDPQLLTATPGGSDSITLSWGGVQDDHTPDAGLTYNLRVGTSPGSQDIMPSHAQPDTGLLRIPVMGNVNHNASWTLTGLAEGIFYWSVQAIDQVFSGSKFAAEQNFTIADPPAAPTGLVATPGDGQVDLSWTANTEADLAVYDVYRATVDDINQAVEIADVTPPAVSYSDQTVQNGITYYYWVTAEDALANESAFSQSVSARPLGYAANTGSARFSGGERIRVLDNAPVDPANADPSAYALTGPMTLEAWIYPFTLPAIGDTIIIASRPYTNEMPAYELRFVNPEGGAMVEFEVSEAAVGGATATVSADIMDRVWTHVAGTHDTQVARLVINGSEVASTSAAWSRGAGSTGFYIGGTTDHWYRGFIDEVRLWGAARAAQDIADLRSQTLLGNETDLVGYWPLDEMTSIAGVDDVTIDLTANSNHLHVQYGAYFYPAIPFGEPLEPNVLLFGSKYVVVGRTWTARPIVTGGPGTTLSLLAGPGNMGYDQGQLSYTPQPGEEGYQDFTLRATNTTGQTDEEYRIWVEEVPISFVDHDNNNTILSVFNHSLLGHDPSIDEGSGFLFNPPGDSVDALYMGGLVLALSPTQVSGGSGIRDYATRGAVEPTEAFLPEFDQAYMVTFDDSRALNNDREPNGIGMRVTQNSYSKSTSPDDDYVILDYLLENTSGASLNGLYIGLYSDWDVGNHENNLGGWDDTRNLSYVYEEGGNENSHYYGTVILWGDQVGIGHYVGALGLYDEAELDSLARGINEDLGAVGDMRTLLTVGPYDMPAGDQRRVIFAVAGGTDLTDLQANADAAQTAFSLRPLATAHMALDVSTKGATFTGSVNPNGLDTQVWYQWNDQQGANGGQIQVDPPIGAGASDVYVTATTSSLQAGMSWQFWIRASNSDGETLSEVVTFQTPAKDDFLMVTDMPAVTDAGNTFGASWGDFNNDNALDLFVANSDPHTSILYENQGEGAGWSLNDATTAAQLEGISNAGLGVWGDYDNDDDLDLFVINMSGAANVLYRNDGPGSFQAVTSPFADDGGYSQGAAWADYDNDGDLDLFVANYVDTEVNFLYNNSGPGGTPAYSFTRVTGEPWDSDASISRTGAWADYDNDGDLDLLVANSTNKANFLYQNNGPGSGFTFSGAAVGPVVTDTTASLGVAWGDFDNDGDLDLYAANAVNQPNILYQNDGNGSFSKAPAAVGPIVTDELYSYSGNWADIDNDGDLDLLVGNAGNNAVYINEGDGTFSSVATGLLVTDGTSTYGTAWGDYNNDGLLDLYNANRNGPNRLYAANAGENTNHWINLSLAGTESNRSGVGAKVRVKAAGSPGWQMRQVSTSNGWLSQNSLNVEFGLGTATIIDSIVIAWPSGIVQILTGVDADQFLLVLEQELSEPIAKVLPPTALTSTSATLNGIVVPNGGTTNVQFQWGTTTAYGTTVGVDPVEGGAEDKPVSLALTGLSAGSSYHYRVLADNSAGTAMSGDMMFTTPADENTTIDVQVVVNGPVDFPTTNVTLGITFSTSGEDTITVAQVQGAPSGSLPVDMNLVTQQLWDISHLGTGTIGSVQFQLDVTPDTIPAADQAEPANIKLLRRDDATVAEWTVIAQGEAATRTVVTFSPISGFSQFTVGSALRGVAPTAATVAADGLTTTSAVIHATVNPGGLTTDVTFEWGETTAYGTTIDANPSQIPPGTDPVAVSATLTNLTMNQTYHYRVRATNSESPTPVVGTDMSFTTLFLDEEKPAIASTTIAAGQPPLDVDVAFTVTAVITDNVGVNQVTLHHAPGGGQSYTGVTMSPTGTADEYSSEIPSGAVTLRGVVCYVRAVDAAGNDSLSAPIFIPVQFSQDRLKTSNVLNSAYSSGFPKDQWRLLSVPADLTQPSVSGTIGNELQVTQSDTSWRLFEYTHNTENQWAQAGEFEPGEGYWLYQRMVSNVELTAGAGRNNNLQQEDITLQPGWNLIGTPYCFRTPILLDQGDFYGPISYTGSSWSNIVNQMDPWGGYAVYNRTSTDQVMTLTARPSGGASKGMLAKAAAEEPPAGWVLELQAEGRTYRDMVNAIGRLDGALEGLDRYDNPEPPYVDGYVSLAMARPDWSPRAAQYTSDIRSLQEEDGVWGLDLHFKAERGPVHLSYNLRGDFPADHKIILLDVLTREVYEVSGGELPAPITQYREEFPYHLKIVAGTANYVDHTTDEILAALPVGFALSQNYPNPFNPVTNLRYSLYQPAKVTMKIFNLLGQEVITLVDDWHDLGHYTVAWNGRDRFGNQLASGIYIAAYLAEGKIYSRKMVMMK
ncbi:FG-GAP-like repeat-containing protein [Candidatus Neomarinimicrobiota bacterium]